MMTVPDDPLHAGRTRAAARSQRVYRVLLRAYPREQRDEYGDEMVRCFRDLHREAMAGGGMGLMTLWAAVLSDLLWSALKERSIVLQRHAYRAAMGIALATALLLVWMSLGVGVIGADGDPANLLYSGVLAVGLIGAIAAQFRPQGMARALTAMAIAQAAIASIAVILGLGAPWSPPLEIIVLNGFFIALFVGSALLFRHAGQGLPPTVAGSDR